MNHNTFANTLAVTASAMLLLLLSTIKPPAAAADQHEPHLVPAPSVQYAQALESIVKAKTSALLQTLEQPQPAQPTVQLNWGQWSQDQIECLALNIYHESRGEPFEGQVAVAAVTVNRVHDRRWPSTICDVVHQRAQVSVKDEWGEVIDHKHICQFSWACELDSHRPYETAAWDRSLKVAKQLVQGELDHVAVDYRDAFYFHTDQINPSWAARTALIKQTGAHVFRGDV